MFPLVETILAFVPLHVGCGIAALHSTCILVCSCFVLPALRKRKIFMPQARFLAYADRQECLSYFRILSSVYGSIFLHQGQS